MSRPRSNADDPLAVALTLPPQERERLAHEMLDSLDDEERLSPTEWEAAWDVEIERRVRRDPRGQSRAD